MPHRREVNLATQPALVPLFGGLDKKPRPLDKDVITIGQARGCDIGLVAPDVSALHCVLYRTPEGFRIRDCGSRTGTRLNGEAARQNLLADGDVLQVGPFSFTVKLPPEYRPEPQLLTVQHALFWQRSRRNLIRLALGLRRKLRHGSSADAVRAELDAKSVDLRNRIRQYDQRLNQLEQAERDLSDDRELLQRDREVHQAHVQKVENEIAQRLEETAKEVHARWQEFQQRCAGEEARLTYLARDAKKVAEHHQAEMDRGRRELEELAADLQRDKEQLAIDTQQLQRAAEELQRQRGEIATMREKLAAEQAGTSHSMESQRTAVAQAEAVLREQRSALARMMADLGNLQETIKRQQGGDVQALSAENDDLRHRLADAEQRLLQATTAADTTAHAQLDDLRAENASLHTLLAEKDRALKDLKKMVDTKPAAKPAVSERDLESYEAELNQYRQQLEADRTKLKTEIEQLRLRNAELDEATREMEMEMSKERAELARERIRLDRLRDEVRTEMERMQRDASMRDSLAGVHKLRDEMNQKKGAAHIGKRLGDPA